MKRTLLIAFVVFFITVNICSCSKPSPQPEPTPVPEVVPESVPIVFSMPELTSAEYNYAHAIIAHSERLGSRQIYPSVPADVSFMSDEWIEAAMLHLQGLQDLCDDGIAIECPDSMAYIHYDYTRAMNYSKAGIRLIIQAINYNNGDIQDQGLSKIRDGRLLRSEVEELIEEFIEIHSRSVPEAGLKITAEHLCSEYEMNEIAADQKYKEQMLEVTGIVCSIGSDISDGPYVILKSDENTTCGVHCTFSRAYESEIAKLINRQVLTITGTCKGKVIGNIFLEIN